MRVVLTLKKLLEYFENGKLFDRWLDTGDKNLADFKALIPDIDKWLLWWYRTELVQTERNSIEFTYWIVSWWKSRVDDFNMVYQTMTKEYDPLSNYDMTEKEGSVSDRNKISNNQQNSGSLTTVNGARSNTYYSSTNVGGSASDAKWDNKTEGAGFTDTTTDTRGINTTNGYADNQTALNVTVGEDTISGNEKNERVLTRKGNIGVTTSQDMALSELNLRKESFVKFFAETFERECLTGMFDYDWLGD